MLFLNAPVSTFTFHYVSILIHPPISFYFLSFPPTFCRPINSYKYFTIFFFFSSRLQDWKMSLLSCFNRCQCTRIFYIIGGRHFLCNISHNKVTQQKYYNNDITFYALLFIIFRFFCPFYQAISFFVIVTFHNFDFSYFPF